MMRLPPLGSTTGVYAVDLKLIGFSPIIFLQCHDAVTIEVFMSTKAAHRILGTLVLLTSAVQFFTTAQPSVSFWDPGELSAAAYMLQVPHPPGGPLFSLVGRFFYLLPIPGNIGFRMNTVSILCSAFSVFFLYLIAVRLMENFRAKGEQTRQESLTTYLSAVIGALAFSFCDTFWFSGVESNYFAASTLLFSAMTWLMMVWLEKAGEPRSSRYLLLIAYLVGLSAGVHLMSVLTIFAVVMVYVFRNYIQDDAACKQTGLILLGHIGLLLVVAFMMWSTLTSKQVPMPDDYRAYDKKFIVIMAVVSAAVVALFWKKVVRRDSIYLPISIAGIGLFVAYPGVIKKLPEIIHTISRDDSNLGVAIVVFVLLALGYLSYWSAKNQKSLLHISALGVMFIILGFSTYTMIVTRANHHPPMNENNPKDFSGLMTYLNREQYGEFPIFKRRWSPEADRQRTYTNYSSDFDFFWRYQMNHMFNRYLFFNFIGRDSRVQDADWTWKQLFGIPFIVGLFGLYYHFRKDWKMATSFLVLFVLMGYLIAFYQNQQEPQPRERDYFYPAALFVFSLWIAIGIRGMLDEVKARVQNPRFAALAVGGTLLVTALLIPARMFQTNYYTHDRSKNWFPRDYAYNLLQSCEQDAILFTNGDNDTFPLWYLQDVEGVRRDVRVVCLSLVNTPWYIQQMKDKPYYPEAKAVPISLSDAMIGGLGGLIQWQPQKVVIPVPREALTRYSMTDTARFNREAFGHPPSNDTGSQGGGTIEFTMKNTVQYGQAKAIRTQDYMVKNIIESARWQRPVYFASTCAPDSKIGIDEYLRFCGLAWRLEPFKAGDRDMGIDPAGLEPSLLNEPTELIRTPHYGYRFTSIADPGVYFDENERHMCVGLRTSFRALIGYETDVRHDDRKATELLERMNSLIPLSRVPMPMEQGFDFAYLAYRLGKTKIFDDLYGQLDSQFHDLGDPGQSRNVYYSRSMLQLYELKKDYSSALDLLKRLAVTYPNDQSIRQHIDSVQTWMRRSAPVQ